MDPTKPPTKIQRLILKVATGAICHPRVRSLQLRLHKKKYAKGTKPGRLSFFFALDDPYLPLIVDQIAALPGDYRVIVDWIPLATAYDAADPQSAMRKQYMQQDANREARLHGLRVFEKAPDPSGTQTLTRIATAVPSEALGAWVPQAVKSLWYGEESPALRPVVPDQAVAILQQNAKLRDRLGHYEAGMIKFDADWYWAYGRLDFLTERLDFLGLRKAQR